MHIVIVYRRLAAVRWRSPRHLQCGEGSPRDARCCRCNRRFIDIIDGNRQRLRGSRCAGTAATGSGDFNDVFIVCRPVCRRGTEHIGRILVVWGSGKPQFIGIFNRKRAAIGTTGNRITDAIPSIRIRGIQGEDVGSGATVFIQTPSAGARELHLGVRRGAAATRVRPGTITLCVFGAHLHLIRCPFCQTAQCR